MDRPLGDGGGRGDPVAPPGVRPVQPHRDRRRGSPGTRSIPHWAILVAAKVSAAMQWPHNKLLLLLIHAVIRQERFPLWTVEEFRRENPVNTSPKIEINIAVKHSFF